MGERGQITEGQKRRRIGRIKIERSGNFVGIRILKNEITDPRNKI